MAGWLINHPSVRYTMHGISNTSVGGDILLIYEARVDRMQMNQSVPLCYQQSAAPSLLNNAEFQLPVPMQAAIVPPNASEGATTATIRTQY